LDIGGPFYEQYLQIPRQLAHDHGDCRPGTLTLDILFLVFMVPQSLCDVTQSLLVP
jgi:hypothetical protein